MVVVMKKDAREADIERVSEKVRDAGGEAFVSRGAVHTIIGLVGDTAAFMGLGLDNFPGVDHLIQVGKPYKMVARALHPQPTTVKVGPAAVGRETFTITGIAALGAGQTPGTVAVSNDTGIGFDAVVRIDTPGEADYYRHGGILPYVLRKMLAA